MTTLLRSFVVAAALCSLSLTAAHAAGNRALSRLSGALDRAQQATGDCDISYLFKVEGDALGVKRDHSVPTQFVRHDARSYFVASGRPTGKLFVDERTYCAYEQNVWECKTLAPEAFTANLKSATLNLYPPTVLALTHRLIATHGNAVVVSGSAQQSVAGRNVDVFRITVDPGRLPAKTANELLYARAEPAGLWDYVVGITVELGFDPDTGALLLYRNDVAFDQAAAAAHPELLPAGTDAAALRAAPVANVRAGFEATRVSTTAPTTAAFYQLPTAVAAH